MKKSLSHQTHCTSIRLRVSTIKSQYYLTTNPKIIKIPKATSHQKKVSQFLSIGFPDLIHRRHEPHSPLFLRPSYSLRDSSSFQKFLLLLSSPSSSCFFFSLRFLGFLGTFRDLPVHKMINFLSLIIINIFYLVNY